MTPLSTLDNNPNELGHLTGWTVETQAPVVFDVETKYDVSEQAYTKSIEPNTSFVGSTLRLFLMVSR